MSGSTRNIVYERYDRPGGMDYFVLVTLADVADDLGHVPRYYSLASLASKCNVSTRYIRTILKSLEDDGVLIVESGLRTGSKNTYTIDLQYLRSLPYTKQWAIERDTYTARKKKGVGTSDATPKIGVGTSDATPVVSTDATPNLNVSKRRERPESPSSTLSESSDSPSPGEPIPGEQSVPEAPAASEEKPIPANVELVIRFEQLSGVKLTARNKAIGQARKLLAAGVTSASFDALYNYVRSVHDDVDMGSLLNAVDRWNTAGRPNGGVPLKPRRRMFGGKDDAFRPTSEQLLEFADELERHGL